MNCNLFTQNILPYLNGELEEQQQILYEEHRIACSECNSLFNQIHATYAILDAERNIIPSADFTTAALHRLKNNSDKKVYQFIPTLLKPLAVAASIALGIMIGNGETTVLNLNDDLSLEATEVFIPTVASDYSIWETIPQEDGN